jgi:GPH family glycoside/pentoside/hexuronide:cation symporter
MSEPVAANVPIQHEKKVPTKSAVWLSFADCMCGLMCSFAEGSVLSYFFVYYLKLEESWASIVWILFGIWNAINDPIYGFIADRTKTKIGRRIPWIRYGAPIYAVLFILTWVVFPSMQGNQWFLAFQMAICLFFFDTLYTAIASALYVMPYEMAVTNQARSPIFVWKIVFSLISTGVPMFMNANLAKILAKGYPTFMWIMVGIGVLGGIIIFLSTFFYKENGYVKDEPQPKFWDGLLTCLKNKSFLLFEVISFTVIYAQSNLMNGLSAVGPMWNSAYIGDASIYVCYGAMAIGAVAALLLFIKFRDKWGAKNCAVIMCVAMAAGCFLGAFLGRYFWALVIAFLLIGVGFAGGMYLVPVINGDVIDKDEMVNGSRREGTYAGVNSLITKPAQSIAQASYLSIFAAFGLDKTNQIADPDTGELSINWAGQSDSAKNGLFIAWLLIPAILLVLSAVAMYFFPLHGKKWLDEKAVLAKAHADKEAAYEQEVLKKEAEAAQPK